MVTRATTDRTNRDIMQPSSFERFAGFCATLTGIISFLYSIAFVVVQNNLLYSLLLLAAGLLSTAQ